jgi:hypothetical protein
MSQIPITAGASSRTIQTASYIESVSNAGGLIELQTTTSHNMLTGDIVSIFATGTFDGEYVLSSIPDATHMILANSFYRSSAGAGAIIDHIGWVAGSIPVPLPILITSITSRLELLSSGTTLRVVYFDSFDSEFTSEQALASVGAGFGSGAPYDGIYRTLPPIPFAAIPDIRLGGYLRVKVYLRVPFASATLSAWLT